AAPRDVPYAMPQSTTVTPAPMPPPAPTSYAPVAPAPLPKPRSKTGLLVLAILGALFLLGGGALMLINSGLVGPAKAPSLIGLSFDNARAALASNKAGFTLQQASDKQFNETVPANMICRQDPAPGGRCQKGQAIVVTLSRGPAVKVPDLVGQTGDAARATLMSVGKLPLQISDEQRYHDSIAAGQIMSQTPSAGTEVERGDAVRVVLSKGPEPQPAYVPDTETPPSGNWGWEHSDAPDEDIYRAVDSWIARWESGNANDYVMLCYHPDATIYSNKKNYTRSSFFAHQQNIMSPSANINISRGGIDISEGPDGTVQASFNLDYRRIGGKNGGYHSAGRQVLVFGDQGNRFGIIKDEFYK
ncbi:MAG: PASTA domain-containing protein, partial [Armatimonadia bacterium]